MLTTSDRMIITIIMILTFINHYETGNTQLCGLRGIIPLRLSSDTEADACRIIERSLINV